MAIHKLLTVHDNIYLKYPVLSCSDCDVSLKLQSCIELMRHEVCGRYPSGAYKLFNLYVLVRYKMYNP